MSQHRVIPIFIPQRACPFRCTYCNQFAISGQTVMPTPEDVDSTVRAYLSTMPATVEKRIAFFGGSFTGMPIAEQNAYLDVALPYVRQGAVSGIQLSTRPDYIDAEILRNLKAHGVVLVELGAQSLDEEVLRAVHRGHTVQDVERSARMIRDAGFQLGLQMMIGLPGDTQAKALHTAHEIVRLGASCTRIYPTLVVAQTPLAQQFFDGAYQPLTLPQAVAWCKELYLYFQSQQVTILRMGLHPSEGLLSGRDFLAGPFHVSFKELVLTAIWHDKISRLVAEHPDAPVVVDVPRREMNYAIGYGSANRKSFPQVTFRCI